MKTIIFGCMVTLFLSVAVASFGQFTVTTNIVGNENWNTAGAWTFPAGFAPFETFPNNDFDEDASTAAANGDYGLHIIIDTNDEITIPNNVTIDLQNSSISTITIKAGATLHFASNSKIRLPSGARIILETGAGIEADNNSAGSLIEIGGNGVWGRACPGCTNEDLTGPGFIDENSTPGDPLPITLLFFTGSIDGNVIRLGWATSMEMNFEKFVVQRSDDGITYYEIGEVPGKGHDFSNTVSEYSFEDQNPLIAFNYYRLKAVDLNGENEFFQPIVIRMEGAKLVSVYPNPASGEQLNVSLNFNPSETDILLLIDARGNELDRRDGNKISYHLTLADALKPGIYFVRFISADFQQTTRVTVK